MQIHVRLLNETVDSTVSEMLIDDQPAGIFVLEDGWRDKKVPGSTRIPKGRYKVIAATEGNFYKQYSTQYGHKFSLFVKNVPDFSGIMIHIGNDIVDTKGCLLVGKIKTDPTPNGPYSIKGSTMAYQELYSKLEPVFYDLSNNKFTGAEVDLLIDRTGSAFEK